MSTYIVGDIHGCFKELDLLLNKVSFNPKNDVLWVTGDLVFRGELSLSVLQFLYSLNDSLKLVLGNNDINLLKVYLGLQKVNPSDKISEFLKSDDCEKLINWLRSQPFIQVDHEKKLIMVHAGIPSCWDLSYTLKQSKELQSIISGNDYVSFLSSLKEDINIYYWDKNDSKLNQMYYALNALTKMRYCTIENNIHVLCRDSAEANSFGLVPWFTLHKPHFYLEDYTLIFGHWSAIQGKGTPKNIIGMDTGCCWGGTLTMMRWEDKVMFSQNRILPKN